MWTATTGTATARPAVVILADHVPNHTFHLIPAAGHSPWLEQPELVRQVLRSAIG